MYLNVKSFREKMDSGKLCLGPGITFADPAVTESIAPLADFVWIDLEHNPTDLQSMATHLMAARAAGTMAIVRVPSRDVGWIKRVLDSGAEGVILPQARSYEEAAAFVSACRYPPKGERGYGPRRPTDYGRIVGSDYLEIANRELFVVVQIETAGALNDLDRIVRIEGLDSIVVGPYDLSGSLGMLGNLEHPKVAEAVSRIVKVGRESGLYVGMGMGASPDFAATAAKLGVHWIQAGNDFEYMNLYASRLYREIRGKLDGKS